VKTLRSAALTILLAMIPAMVRGQSTDAAIAGRITDPAKATVPHAKVEIINTATNLHCETETDDAGSYVVTNLSPGTYRIEVEKQGFKSVVKPDVTLHVQDTVEINFEMVLGSASETVTVEGGAPLVDTTDAAVSTVVDRQFAENLPMNGRSFQTLIELTPGVVLTTSNPADSGQFSVNGQRAASNYWMVDGVSANIGVSASPGGFGPGNGLGGTLGSFSVLGGTNSLVSVDAMQEFRIQTSTYAPEFGRTPGGQISIVTRSGTNQLHGTAFDYLRNDIFDASNWFNGYTNNPPLPKAEERQNDFGGTFNGPILKDKTFFFFSYEGLRLRLPQTTLTTVPDLLARQNAVPAMQPYFNAYPLPKPNEPDAAPGIAPFDASYSNAGTLDAYSIRIDHKLSDKFTLFGRYNYSPSSLLQRGANALSVVNPEKITTQTATVGATWMISPTVTNELRFNYSRTNSSSYYYLDNFGGAVPIESLPFPSPFNSQNGALVLNISPLQGGVLQAGKSEQNLQRQINIVENLSEQKGTHSLKFGVDFRRLSPSVAPALYQQFVFLFDLPSAQIGDGLGLVQPSTSETLLFHNLGVFAQDTWHMASRLTLTYGLRWDMDFAPSSVSGPSLPAVTGYNLNDFSQLAVAPAGTPPFKTTYGNVAPRIGLAYQLNQNQNWQAVLRAGFGFFYDLASSETGQALGVGTGNPPFGALKLLLGPSFGSTAIFPYTLDEAAPPVIPPTGNISQLYAFNPNLKLPYTMEWNVAWEQALGKQQTITASYVGAAGRRLLQTSRIIAPPSNPDVSGFFVDNTAISDYDALQLQFQRRLTRGLQTVASYLWSHSIDTASAASWSGSISNAGVPGSPNLNRGPSDFDIRNAFSAGLTYDVPTPKFNAFANAILRSWSTDNFIMARSAPPVDLSDYNLTLQGFVGGIQANVRPDLVPGQPLYLYGSQYPGGKAFNPSAFTNPPVDPNTGVPVRQGDVPRNFLRGFGAVQWDFGVHRDFPIRESLHLQFRAEMFNVLNHPNFGQPNGSFGAAGFGLSSQMLGQSLNGANLGGGAFSPLYQIGGPRSIQFALKLAF